uniref:Uncharacterized protein n=1 Tax=Moniliophthora roreri TaxID=221103 RepID=A0A0W0F9K7_MONRR
MLRATSKSVFFNYFRL